MSLVKRAISTARAFLQAVKVKWVEYEESFQRQQDYEVERWVEEHRRRYPSYDIGNDWNGPL